jgi:hypothetical protein
MMLNDEQLEVLRDRSLELCVKAKEDPNLFERERAAGIIEGINLVLSLMVTS